MVYCLNPSCPNPQNSDEANICQACRQPISLARRYRALKPIGQGGFGRTFLAEGRAGQLCVIKQLFWSRGRPPTPEVSARFRAEAERLKQLGAHPQIPQLWEYFEDETGQYLIQAYISGATLEAELKAQGAFSEAMIIALLEAMLPVLEYVHSFRVIHRDIKPDNIIQPANGLPVLVDFGAAKLALRRVASIAGPEIGPEIGLNTETVIGSAEYTAPEQTMGKATFASDLYSLGVTCLHLLTDMPPFDLYSVGEDRWVWRDYLTQPVGDRLAAVLDKLVARPLRSRYSQADHALRDLRSPKPLIQLPASLRSFLPASPRLRVSASPPLSPSPPLPSPYQRRYRLNNPVGVTQTLAVSPNGQTLATGCADGTIYLWQLDTGELLHTFAKRRGFVGQGHRDQISSLKFHPQGHLLYSASYDGTIKAWNLQDCTLLRTLPEQGWMPTGLAISPKGRWLISAGGTGKITLWDLVTLTPELPRTQHPDRVSAVDIDAVGQRFASASWDGTVRVWQLPGGQTLATFKAHADRINALVMHPAGEHVISGGKDGQVKVWRLGTPLGTPLTCNTLHTAQDSITALALSPDARLLAVGTEGNVLTLWQGTTGECLARLDLGWGVVAIAFAPDGQTLVASSRDETISVWEMGRGKGGRG
ncbi:MAG: serine/threonine-protein kinase [Cyanobacteria bacterium P01_A01_bin.114]